MELLHSIHGRTTPRRRGLVYKKPSPPTPQRQIFTVGKCSALQSSDDAEVYMSSSSSRSGGAGAAAASSSSSSGGGLGCKHPQAAAPGYRVEGSFSRRSCKIRRGGGGKEAARIVRKKAGVASRPVATLGDDVFSLVVRPGVDVATIMAIVVVMDRNICHRPYTPMVCASSSQ